MYFSVSKVVSLGGGFLNSNINLKHVFKKPETKKMRFYYIIIFSSDFEFMNV